MGPSELEGQGWSGHRAAMVRLALLAWLVVLGTCGFPSSAVAHANLTSASPEPLSTTHGAPSQVQLHFGWPTVPDDRTTVSVIVPSGRDIARGDPVSAGLGVAQRLLSSRELGWYRVRFTVGFADGHVRSGVFRFRVSTFEQAAPDTTKWVLASGVAGTVFVAYVVVVARRKQAADRSR